MNEAQQVTPAGWYDDGQGHQRWWDGFNWGPIAPPVAQPVKSRTMSGISIAGFVIAVVALTTFGVPVLCTILLVLGALFSGAGLIDTRYGSKRGRGFSAAGFIISVSILATLILLTVIR